MVKIISFNVNGLNSIIQKGKLQQLILEEKPDILCLQEIKSDQEKCQKLLSNAFTETPYVYECYSAEKKGYSGVAVFSLTKPKRIQNGIPISFGQNDGDKETIRVGNQEGRLQLCEFKGFTVINVYQPNSQPELKRLPFRLDYEKVFRKYVKSLGIKNLIICGDFNVARHPIDLARPTQNTKNPGFTKEERNAFEQLIELNDLTNAFRYKHPNAVKYTYWSYIGNARSRNVGWHIDYFLVSKNLITKNSIKDADVMDDFMGSDHAPIVLTLKQKI